jgi:uncharacterized protein
VAPLKAKFWLPRPAKFRVVLPRAAARRRGEVVAISIQDLSVFCEDLPSGVEAPDPKDSYLLALAEAGQAQYLVTGDKELLELGGHKATKIISPRDFAALFDLNAAP